MERNTYDPYAICIDRLFYIKHDIRNSEGFYSFIKVILNMYEKITHSKTALKML